MVIIWLIMIHKENLVGGFNNIPTARFSWLRIQRLKGPGGPRERISVFDFLCRFGARSDAEAGRFGPHQGPDKYIRCTLW